MAGAQGGRRSFRLEGGFRRALDRRRECAPRVGPLLRAPADAGAPGRFANFGKNF